MHTVSECGEIQSFTVAKLDKHGFGEGVHLLHAQGYIKSKFKDQFKESNQNVFYSAFFHFYLF